MEKKRYLEIYNKINELLHKNSISKGEFAERLNLTNAGLSCQLNNLKNGKPISLETLIVLEELVGEKIFNF